MTEPVKIGMSFSTLLSKERARALYESAQYAARLDGEFWDCGCHTGGSSALIKFAAPRRLLRMFDSFEGLPLSSEKDNDVGFGMFKVPYDEYLWILGSVYDGWIPDTFLGLENSRIAFAHVDLDLYQGTKDALEFIIPRLIPNGTIVVDDYGSVGWKGVKTAVDEIVGKQFSRTVLAPEQIVLTKIS